jgi:hypothetical protein
MVLGVRFSRTGRVAMAAFGESCHRSAEAMEETYRFLEVEAPGIAGGEAAKELS